MEKEFVTYEQALALKELGFNEPCLAKFIDTSCGFKLDLRPIICTIIRIQEDCPAPLKQQAIMFLLNKHDELYGAEASIEYFGDESGSINRHLGFGTLWDAIEILKNNICDNDNRILNN